MPRFASLAASQTTPRLRGAKLHPGLVEQQNTVLDISLQIRRLPDVGRWLPSPAWQVLPTRLPPLERLLCNASGSMPTPPKPALLPYDVVTVPACRNASAPAWSKCCATVPGMPFPRPVYNYKITNWANGDCFVLATGTTYVHGTGRTMCPMYNVRSSCIRLLHVFGRSPGTSLLP